MPSPMATAPMTQEGDAGDRTSWVPVAEPFLITEL